MSAQRGTTNRNVRGNVYDRRARRAYLLTTFGDGVTCRCVHCSDLLDDSTITVDRIVPGVAGGTYRRDNIVPSCMPCASKQGGHLAQQRPYHQDLLEGYRAARDMALRAEEQVASGYDTEIAEHRETDPLPTFGQWLTWNRR